MEITQQQKYEILRNEIQKGVGLDQIVKLGLEILMKTEREEHNSQTGDYNNGYRYRKMFGSGKMLELKPPRVRIVGAKIGKICFMWFNWGDINDFVVTPQNHADLYITPTNKVIIVLFFLFIAKTVYVICIIDNNHLWRCVRDASRYMLKTK